MRGRFALFVVATCVIAGCGGGAASFDLGTGQTGIKVSAVFDPATRTVPGYADTVRVQIFPPDGYGLPFGETGIAELTRTTTAHVFDFLTAANSDYRVEIRALTDGNTVGYATLMADINEGRLTSVNVSNNLNSSINKIVVTGPTNATQAPQQLTATAYDVQNNVLFSGQGFSWGTTDPSVMTVNSLGQMIAVSRGYCNVVAWVNNPLLSTERLTASLGYVPTRVLVTGLGGSITGMRDIGGEWKTTFDDPLGGALDVAIDNQERIYILNGSYIVRIDDLSGYGRVTYNLGSITPSRIDVDPSGRIYLLDRTLKQVHRMDNMTGANFVSFGSYGSGVNQFREPSDLTIGRDGAIYVTDWSLNRVARFTSMTGANWRTYGTTGTGVGKFSGLGDVDTDEDGFIYVADTGNHRICRFFTMTGGSFVSYGTEGTGVGQFGDFVNLSIDGQGLIYLHDIYNHRIVRLASIFGDYWVQYSLPVDTIGGPIEVPDF